jgi:hypothetical protein
LVTPAWKMNEDKIIFEVIKKLLFCMMCMDQYSKYKKQSYLNHD